MMTAYHYVLIIALTAIIAIRIILWWGNHWKKRAREAYMVIGQHGESPEEREWGYRNALLAGERKALLFYVCTAMDKFMGMRPLTPQGFDDGQGSIIPYVFYDYYLPMRLRGYGTESQKVLSQLVYDFKEGRADATDYYLRAIASLGLSGQLTILFMPCSSERRYYQRFSKLSRDFGRYRELEPELYSMKYIAERRSKHRSTDRWSISPEDNIIVDANVVGKQNCVLLDDVCTTGDSIRAHIAELRCYGVRVVGVVCLGQTAHAPTHKEIMKQARKDDEQ